MTSTRHVTIGLLILVTLATGCKKGPAGAAAKSPAGGSSVEVQIQRDTPLAVQDRRIFYVDSYHPGYPWNEGIARGIRSVLEHAGETRNLEFEVFHMDSKRNTDEAFIEQKAREAFDRITAWGPDVVICSDDNAVKYLVVPYLADSGIPVVFCGVNWDASAYGLPSPTVTGMIEVALIPQMMETLRTCAAGDRVGLLAADNISNHKEADNYKSRCGLPLVREVFVEDFQAWKAAFVELQGQVDMLILGPPSFLTDPADMAEADRFVLEQTRIPTGSVEDWIARWSLVCYAKRADEQGRWAAEAALRILDGTSPADIAVESNRQAHILLNMALAKKLHIIFPAALVTNAEFVDTAQ